MLVTFLSLVLKQTKKIHCHTHYFYFQLMHKDQFLCCYMFRPYIVAITSELYYYKNINSVTYVSEW